MPVSSYSKQAPTRPRQKRSPGIRKAIERPYARARAWFTASADARPRLSRAQLSDFRRIKELGEHWGKQLDELGATYQVVRWVAGPVGCEPSAQLARARAVVAALREGPLTHKRFAGLKEAHPAFRRKGRGEPHTLELLQALGLLVEE